MPPLELLVAGAMLASLVLYAVTGGADYGGGVWDLVARGRRGEQERELIARAIGPIWEANHVWLILVVVLLFVCFPAAFAAISTALHIPLLLMLLGIVLRGSAFVFRAYDRPDPQTKRLWSRVFAVASTVTPVFLGVVAGAVARGLPLDPATGRVATDFVSEWLRPFPLAIGAFTLGLFAFLAAVYLSHDADDDGLRERFRVRALGSGLAVGALAALALAAARADAPAVFDALLGRPWSLPFHAVTGLAAVGALAALTTRRFGLARVLAAAQVALVVVGWGLAQYPFALAPDLTLAAAAAPESVLRPVLIALAAGALVLVPSFAWLYHLFALGRRTPEQP